MNTLVLLVAATCSPAADPMPVMETRVAPIPSYQSNVIQDGVIVSQERRPRFFARLRGLFSRKSQTMDANSQEVSGYAPAIGRNGVIAPNATTYPNFSNGNANPMPYRSQPSFTPSNGSELQRMPTGQPF